MLRVDAASGAAEVVFEERYWIGHINTSPTQPHLLTFCHEGPWQLVDRIWYIDVVAGGPAHMVHDRTMRNEIAGHEFWSADGKWIWYDLQTPIGQVFWVAGMNLETKERIWFRN